MTEKAAKLYRVVKAGVSQRDGDGFVERAVGEDIALSPEALAHLMAEGYLEDPKAKRKTEEA